MKAMVLLPPTTAMRYLVRTTAGSPELRIQEVEGCQISWDKQQRDRQAGVAGAAEVHDGQVQRLGDEGVEHNGEDGRQDNASS